MLANFCSSIPSHHRLNQALFIAPPWIKAKDHRDETPRCNRILARLPPVPPALVAPYPQLTAEQLLVQTPTVPSIGATPSLSLSQTTTKPGTRSSPSASTSSTSTCDAQFAMTSRLSSAKPQARAPDMFIPMSCMSRCRL